jgi:hypothetical protein
MKRISIFILTVSSLLFACQKSTDQTGLSKDQQNFKNYKKAMLSYKGSADKGTIGQKTGNQVTKPFKLSGSGTITISDNIGGCGAGTFRVLSGGPENNGTHLGKFTVLITRCIDFSNGQIIGNIDGVITAADGDKQYFRTVGAGVDPATGIYFEDYIFLGGTGRFANCSGSFHNVFPVLTDTNYSYYGEGTITY